MIFLAGYENIAMETNAVKEVKENVEDYIHTKLNLIKLKTADKAGTAISGVVLSVIVARLFLFIMIFLSFAAAYAISQATGRDYLGFLIVAAFYILVAAGVIIFREKLLTMPLINALLKKLNFKEQELDTTGV